MGPEEPPEQADDGVADGASEAGEVNEGGHLRGLRHGLEPAR